MKALLLAILVGCGAKGGATTSPKLPDKPDVPVAQIVELGQLSGAIDKISIDGAGEMLANEIAELFADLKGKAIDREDVHDRLAPVMRMPGVWSATAKGVQLDGRVKLMIVVEPAPIVRKLTLIEWGKQRPLDGTNMPKPPIGLPLDPSRIEQLVGSQQRRLEDTRNVLVTWRHAAVKDGVEVIIEIARDEIRSP